MSRWRKEPHGDRGNFRVYDEKNEKYIHQGGKQQVRKYEHEIDEIIEVMKERTGDE